MANEACSTRPGATHTWLRLAALALGVAAVGLPVNHLFGYALLLVATVVIFSGRLSLRRRNWLIAIAAVLTAALLPLVLAPAPIAQGENVFLPGKPGNVLEQGLPGRRVRFHARRVRRPVSAGNALRRRDERLLGE